MDDAPNYLGFPVWKTCIFLNIASCSMYIFVLFFLPVGVAIPLMAVELAVGIIGLLASMSSYSSLTRIYLFVQSLMIIPVIVSFLNLVNIYSSFDILFNGCWDEESCKKIATSNERRIMNIPHRILIAAMVFAGIGTLLALVSLVGFSKLRRYQSIGLITKVQTTKMFESHHKLPSAPLNMMNPSMLQSAPMASSMLPQPVYIVDPHKYNVVYQPFGFQQQIQSFAQPQAPVMDTLKMPPGYPVKGGPPNEEHPPGYIP